MKLETMAFDEFDGFNLNFAHESLQITNQWRPNVSEI